MCGADVPINTKAGGGLIFRCVQGVVIHSNSYLGPDYQIMSRAYIGTQVPVLIGNVNMVSGANILGNLKLGDNAIIGANAVVVMDVPSNSTVAGIRAKIFRNRNQQN